MKIEKKNIEQKGFTVVEVLIVLVIVGLVGFLGYTLMNSNKQEAEGDSTSSVEKQEMHTSDDVDALAFEDGLRLQPSDFGVTAGLPVADVSAIQLDDGSWRIYAFAQEQGIVSATSDDGLNFTAEEGVRMGDGAGMPRVIELEDGTLRMYFIDMGGVGSATSTDGLNFVKEDGLRITAPDGVEQISGISTPVKLADGKWHVYFSELPKPGTGPLPHNIYSAVSDDLVNWTNQDGVRIGGGVAATTGEHPDAIVNDDGEVILYFFVNDTQKLVTSKSADGLTFSDAEEMGISCNDPNLVELGDGSYRIYCGDFDHDIGGIVKSALFELNKQ